MNVDTGRAQIELYSQEFVHKHSHMMAGICNNLENYNSTGKHRQVMEGL